MSFLLQLLHAYNKLYVLRFAIYMSEANEKKLKAFILENEWPLTKLEKLCEEEGRKLTLSKVSGIPQTLFDLGRLNTLFLTRCGPLQHDDFQHFEELFELRKLIIINCGLTEIPEQVLAMYWLDVLDLKHNSIKSIPDGIDQLTNLTEMDLSNNELKTIPESFQKLGNLLILYLSNNPNLKVSEIKKVFSCQKLQLLLTSPLSESQENELNDEEKEKYSKITLKLRCACTHDHVIPYDPASAPHVSKIFQTNPDRVYKMDSSPKGITVIINNFYFQGDHPKRHGSQEDSIRLQHLFDQLGFSTVVYENCTASRGKESLRRRAMDETYKNCDSFAVVIMSHGDEVVQVNELVEIVDASPYYKGKPKLFFIQACRGKQQLNNQISRRLYDEADAAFQLQTETNSSFSSNLHFIEPPVPRQADVLLSFSTVFGYVSYRNTKSGAWYINALMEIFSKHAREEDILSLITLVNHQVARLTTINGWKQIPAPQSTLTRKLYLLPGYTRPKEDKT